MELHTEIKKTFPKLEKFFSKESLSDFLQTPEQDLGKYSFGLGTMIKLKLLQDKNILYKSFVSNGFSDRDEMAMEIIKRFHKYMKATQK